MFVPMIFEESIVNPPSNYNMCFWNCIAYHEIKNKRFSKFIKKFRTTNPIIAIKI
jgi:hypothetical protein